MCLFQQKKELTELGAALLTADEGAFTGLVVGQIFPGDFRDLDLINHEVVCRIDGTEVARGTGFDVLGDPINALVFAVNYLSAHGIGIQRGQLISTGTMTGIQPVLPGQSLESDFGFLGKLSATFS